MILSLVVSFVIGIFIIYVYRKTYTGVVYSKAFSLCILMLSMVTAMIIRTISANISLSLGMVGALSIVRFRTAIKEPKDLLFLFWSISNGIIIGAGLYAIVCVLAVVLSIALVVFELIPSRRKSMLLVVNLESIDDEQIILNQLKKHRVRFKTKSRNVFRDKADIMYEIATRKDRQLVSDLSKLSDIISLNLIKQD